jgi:hypothetical protein
MGYTITPRKATVAELADQIKRYVIDDASQARVAAGANRGRQVLALIRGRFPTAEETFGATALLAFARTGGDCYWCRTWPHGADPYNAPTWTLLGRPCGRCFGELRRRFWRISPEGRQAAMDRYRRSREQP